MFYSITFVQPTHIEVVAIWLDFVSMITKVSVMTINYMTFAILSFFCIYIATHFFLFSKTNESKISTDFDFGVKE
jgi:hypothetical protein